ncbi:MAG: hypothetical protein OEV28_12565 [Nitrospirota bacterium]|nr:hypothetical protein [Nitrospirota bacterium]
MKRSGKEWAAFFVGLWVIIGVAFAGLTFTWKVVEIVRTVPRGDVAGFAAIQVVTYVLVAIGFFCLFAWSFLKGDFKDLERAKYLVLEMEAKAEEMERRG